MDIMDNSKEGSPRYFHIFIGTNNRYAVVHPLNTKNANDCGISLREFIDEYHPVKLTSDQRKKHSQRRRI